MQRFNVREWRRLPMWRRLLALRFCKHQNTTELKAFAYRYLGDEPEEPCHFGEGLMTTQVLVKECCSCGHIFATHTYTSIDRSGEAFRRALDRHFKDAMQTHS